MDPERQIRFLYPPLFLVASLAWGLSLDQARSIGDIVPLELFKDPATSILSVVAGGGILVTALGFLVNSIPWAVFRLWSHLRYEQSHEAMLSNEALDRIQSILGYRHKRTPSDALFLAATFDHSKLDKSVHSWLVRRWNAFNINASVVVALVLALAIGRRLQIHLAWEWMLTSSAAGVVFGLMSFWAWQDTRGMIEFQARLQVDALTAKGEALQDSPRTS
jgi:hypothetical protein